MLLDRTATRKINVSAEKATGTQGNVGTQQTRTLTAQNARLTANLNEMPLEVQTYYYKFRAGLNR